MRHRIVVAAAVGLGLSAFAAHAADMAPEDIVRSLYAGYMSGSQTQPDKSAEQQIRPFASRALGRAIDAEIHCETTSGDVCAIDSDYVIAGQDWGRLRDFRIDRSETQGRLILRARFREENITPDRHVVTYTFVREQGAWRIDDVEDDGAAPSLKAAIESYFRQYDENNHPRKTRK